MLKRTSILLLTLVFGVAFYAGCGADMTVRDVETVFAQPSQPATAGVLSGAGVSSGGEHYQSVHTVGAPTTNSQQTSENGTYEVR